MNHAELRQIHLSAAADHPAVVPDRAPRRGYRRYLLALALPCLLMFGYLGLGYLTLDRNRENIGPVQAAEMQVAQGGLYGSALFYRPALYKLRLYELTKPAIAVIGSSRAMEFRADGFAVPEVNLAGNAATLSELSGVIDRMLEIHRPKMLIVTIDYWWFNDARSDDEGHSNSLSDTRITLQHLMRPLEWVFEGSARPMRLLLPPRATETGEPLIGVAANQRIAGFDRNGAYHYGSLLTGDAKSDDYRFKSSLKRIAKSGPDSKLAISSPFSEEMWQRFEAMTARIRAAGVELVLVIPPVATPLAKAMAEKPKPLLIDTVRERLKAANEPTFDFHDSTTLGTADCEFIDGYHGGEVTALRMLRTIAEAYRDRPELQSLLRKPDDLAALIAANAGHAALAGPPLQGKEQDFLGLGCAK